MEMTIPDKIQFVNELIESVRHDIIKKIERSNIPDDGIRVNEEIRRETQQKDVYDEIDILDPENMDNSEIASWQWCRDNPDWYKDL